MSMELYVAVPSSSLPSPDQITDRLRTDGFDLTIEPFNWDDQSGYVPMVIEGEESGTEVYVAPGEESEDVLTPFGRSTDGVHRVVSFRWGGDLSECACSLAVASALASLTGGWILDPHSGVQMSPSDALNDARVCMKDGR